MTGWIIYGGIAGFAVIMGVMALVAWYKGERLDAELTAYVAAGSMSAETAKSVLATAATTARKREIAALSLTAWTPRRASLFSLQWPRPDRTGGQLRGWATPHMGAAGPLPN